MDKPLWAPWRMEFIKAPKPAGCIFCEFPSRVSQINSVLKHHKPEYL